MSVTQAEKITGDDLDTAWQLYANAFADLVPVAAFSHLMEEDAFGDLCADPRITKFRAYDDLTGDLIGMSALTYHLNAVPLISPGYFAAHWPEHYSRRAIYWCSFVCASPGNGHAFAALAVAMRDVIRAENGIVGVDYCSYNEDARKMPEVMHTLLSGGEPGTRRARVDTQAVWMLRFDGEPVL